MGAVPKYRMTYAEYLVAEAQGTVKHEFLRGEIWAMAGGTLEHARLQINFASELRKALDRRPCNVYSSDARLRILETDRATYPDVSVVCGEVQTAPDDRHAMTNPVILVEVLSDGTEAEDRFEKFAHYRRIPSLREYVLVGQHSPRIEVYRREGAQWILTEAGPGEKVHLTSIECQIAVDDVYRNNAASG